MMRNRQNLGDRAVAISISDSPDMPVLGLSEEHLRDAMAEIARHLLALGAQLVYGGDLRSKGFTKLLYELVARHRRDSDADDSRPSVVSYLAWPVHIRMEASELEKVASDMAGLANLVCLTPDGKEINLPDRLTMPQVEPTDAEWGDGLFAMRQRMCSETQARIVVGGRVDQYKGNMPGIAEEALLSLQAKQPLFVLGGFGGCARDIAETIGLIPPWAGSRPSWPGRDMFGPFAAPRLNNGLNDEENATLARTPHVDQAVTLILTGLLRLGAPAAPTP